MPKYDVPCDFCKGGDGFHSMACPRLHVPMDQPVVIKDGKLIVDSLPSKPSYGGGGK